jgi:hypothetical protein
VIDDEARRRSETVGTRWAWYAVPYAHQKVHSFGRGDDGLLDGAALPQAAYRAAETGLGLVEQRGGLVLLDAGERLARLVTRRPEDGGERVPLGFAFLRDQ